MSEKAGEYAVSLSRELPSASLCCAITAAVAAAVAVWRWAAGCLTNLRALTRGERRGRAPDEACGDRGKRGVCLCRRPAPGETAVGAAEWHPPRLSARRAQLDGTLVSSSLCTPLALAHVSARSISRFSLLSQTLTMGDALTLAFCSGPAVPQWHFRHPGRRNGPW